MTENLEQQVNQALDELKKYCEKPEIQVSSQMKDVTDSLQFKNIVSLGKEALPFIYRRFKERGVNYDLVSYIAPIVKAIAGDEFKIPKILSGLVARTYNHTLSWLENKKYT